MSSSIPTTPISRRPGGERTLLSDMRNEIGEGTQRGLRDGRFAPRAGQVSALAAELDVSSGPLTFLDYASAAEHERFINTLFADEADGGGGGEDADLKRRVLDSARSAALKATEALNKRWHVTHQGQTKMPRKKSKKAQS